MREKRRTRHARSAVVFCLAMERLGLTFRAVFLIVKLTWGSQVGVRVSAEVCDKSSTSLRQVFGRIVSRYTLRFDVSVDRNSLLLMTESMVL